MGSVQLCNGPEEDIANDGLERSTVTQCPAMPQCPAQEVNRFPQGPSESNHKKPLL